MKPSERIIEIQRAIIAERIAKLETDGTASFLHKISGASTEEITEHERRNPLVLLAAIVAYLDEQHDKA